MFGAPTNAEALKMIGQDVPGAAKAFLDKT